METNNSKKNELNENEEEVLKAEENLTEETIEDLEDKVSNNEENGIINNENEELQQLINGECNNKKDKSTRFFKNILANILDQVILVAVSGVLLLLFDFIIRILGYMVVTPLAVSLIIYFIMNCIYEPIMKKTKLGMTIAKKILNI